MNEKKCPVCERSISAGEFPCHICGWDDSPVIGCSEKNDLLMLEDELEQARRQWKGKLKSSELTEIEGLVETPKSGRATVDSNNLSSKKKGNGIVIAIIATLITGVISYQFGQASGRFAERIEGAEVTKHLINLDNSGQVSTGGVKTGEKRIAGIDMVWVPRGEFMMGSLENKVDKRPVHKVTFSKGFWMGKYEITQSEWLAIMGENPSEFSSHLQWLEVRLLGGQRSLTSGRGRPVERMSWNDIQVFIKKLNQQTGKTFRLPSEAEWEYAARAGSITKYSWGDNISCDKANYKGGKNSSCYFAVEDKLEGTKAVGSYSANAYGLYDMHGNVSEWVQDCWNGSYKGAPSNGSSWLSGDCGQRVLRGGSWLSSAYFLGSANRDRFVSDVRLNDQAGFRLVQD